MKVIMTGYSKIILSLLLVVTLLTLYAWKIEPNQLKVQHETINPPGKSSLTLLQISDLHIKRISRLHHKIIAETAVNKPDIIVLTGDAIDDIGALDTLSTFLQMLPDNTPVYAVMGNWEYWAGFSPQALTQFYLDHKVKLLINETVQSFHRGDTVRITGLDDLLGGMPSLSDALKETSPGKNHIILAHSPLDYAEREVQNSKALNLLKADVEKFHFAGTLSGHTHGGQITLFGKPLYTPRGSDKYVKGWYEKNIYVSKGIGTSILPIRFMAPPEIVFFTWYLE